MSIISSEYSVFKILESNHENFISIDGGPITNLIYNATLKNIFIECNPNNINQVIIDLTAKKYKNNGGGIWHYDFSGLRIQTLTGNQIGIRLCADDNINGIDVANQYLSFDNVNIYKQSNNSYCMVIIGQIGQTKFTKCEMNGTSIDTKGWIIKFESLESNDNAFMPITFDNCTFQSCDKGIYAINAHLILNNCHVEGIKNQFIQTKGNLAHVSFNNSNISGGVAPFRIEGSGTITGKDNTWTAPTGVACKLEGVPNGVYLFDLDLYMTDMYICKETPFYTHEEITLNVGYSKNILIDKPIKDIQIIKGMFKNGDILTITNISANIVNIENKAFTMNSNLVWSGVNVISLNTNQSVKFINFGDNFYLIGSQRDVQQDLQIKTKNLLLCFKNGMLTTECPTGLNFDNILGFYMVHDDNVYYNQPTISLKTNGYLVGMVKSNPQSDFNITVRVTYLG